MLNISKLLSANIAIDNSADATSIYDITADVAIHGSALRTVHNGSVALRASTDAPLATFTISVGGALTVVFTPGLTPATQTDILSAVNAFTTTAHDTDWATAISENNTTI